MSVKTWSKYGALQVESTIHVDVSAKSRNVSVGIMSTEYTFAITCYVCETGYRYNSCIWTLKMSQIHLGKNVFKNTTFRFDLSHHRHCSWHRRLEWIASLDEQFDSNFVFLNDVDWQFHRWAGCKTQLHNIASKPLKITHLLWNPF